MTMLGRSVTLGLACWLALAPGCRRRSGSKACPTSRQLLLEAVSLELEPTEEAALVDRRDLLALFHRAVADTPGIRFGQSSRCPAARATLQVRLSRRPLGQGKVRITVLLGIEISPLGGRTRTYRAVAERTVREEEPGRDLLRVYERGLRDLLRYPAAEHALASAPPHVVAAALLAGSLDPSRATELRRARSLAMDAAKGIQALFGPVAALAVPVTGQLERIVGPPLTQFERDVREMAIRTAGRRRLRELLPELLELFQYVRRAPPRFVVLDAIVDIGDPRAVPLLTELASYDDPDELGPVVEAVARLGGPKAKSFLQFLADGHPDERIRAMARSALRTIETPGAK